MLFVVIRQIENLGEPQKRDHRVFFRLNQAQAYYKEAEYACWNEPDDTSGNDPPVVTNCWLWTTETDDPVAAVEMAFSQRATLVAECFPPKET
jgi:hypothetical protein